MKRTRIKAMSDKRRADIERRDEVRAAVFLRDRYRCQLEGVEGAGRCWGPLEMHEKRKASQMTDSYTEENGVALCRGHNQGIEQDAALAALARSRGLVLLAEDVRAPDSSVDTALPVGDHLATAAPRGTEPKEQRATDH